MFGIKTKESNGIDIDDWDCPIYRIYPMQWFITLITEKTNGLVNPAKWEDPFESFFLKSRAITSTGEDVSLESLYDSWYGQCWTKNRDSDAMWRIYSHNKCGVRVATTIKKLFSNFYDTTDEFASLKYLIGSVKYIDRVNIEEFLAKTTVTALMLGGQPHKFAETLCIKRPEFSHENEVRLIFQDIGNNKGKDRVATFPFDLNIIDEVALDPRLTENEFKTASNALKKLGCPVSVIQSDLYHMNPITIRFD